MCGKPRRLAPALRLAIATTILPAHAACAETSRIGRTWPIAEPDALAEIELKAAAMPAIAPRFGPPARWAALHSASLGPTSKHMIRTIVPFYTLDADMRLPDGRLLYPKGYTFNPLSYVRLSERLIVVHPRELDWALARARPTDWIIVAGGDPLALGRKANRPLFVLEDQVKARLGLRVAPVIISQVGQKLVLDEQVAATLTGATP